MNKENVLKKGKIILLIIIVALVVFGLVKEIQSIDFAQTIFLIRSFKLYTIVLFLLIGIISNALMTLYDFVIVKYLKLDIKKFIIFNISFVANAINSISGLGGLTGASIRAVFFKKSTNDKEDIVKYSLLLVPATGVGLSVLAIISLIKYQYIEPIIKNNEWLLIVIGMYVSYLIIYFFIDAIYYKIRKGQYNGFDYKILIVKFKLLFISFLEWISAYFLFAIIIRKFDSSIDYYIILGIYTIASVAGIVSMLPGGAGSFDLLIILGFKIYGLNNEHTLAAIILFRTFYYFIPLAVSVMFSIVVQLKTDSGPLNIANVKIIKGFIDKSSPVTNVLLMLLIFLGGFVLLISSMVPGLTYRLKLAEKILSFPIMQWSHQISICVGILLIIMSFKIGMKEKRAYKATYYLLIIGAVSTFLKGFDFEEATFILIILLLLRMSKNSFYRKSLPFYWFNTAVSMILFLIFLIVFAILKHMIFIDFFIKYQFSVLLMKSTIVANYNVMIAYGSLIIFVVLWEVTKPKIENDKRFVTHVDEEKLMNFLNVYKGSFLTHLIYLNDKNIYWAKDGKVAIIYQKSHNVMVILGDVIGDENHFRDGISEFQSFIDEYGYNAAFYEISEKLLPIYHDFGYNFFKLGETALIDLEKFDLQGPKNRDFRNVVSRFKRDGYVFELFEGVTEELFESLKNISDEWLNGRKEMGFSLGSFDEDYLKHSPIAIIKHEISNEIIAFASLMPAYDNNKSLSIDLMRFKKEVPNNTMTFLILSLLIYYKEKGYKVFNLGMAPLSNVGETQNARFSEKAAKAFMRYGKRFYSFEGLRKYKNKFNPNWEARYLAYEDFAILPSSIIEATLLIHAKK